MDTETPVIVKSVHHLLDTYDVTDQHLCINEHGNPLKEIFQEVNARLHKEYQRLCEDIDYFHISDREPEDFPIPYNRLMIFYVRGGSEGYYVHVEVRVDGKHRLLFLGKTLLRGRRVSSGQRVWSALSAGSWSLNMRRCTFHPALEPFHLGPMKYGDRCTAAAEVRILAPDGGEAPGCWYCRPHAQLIIDEYQEKLHENWTTKDLTEGERL